MKDKNTQLEMLKQMMRWGKYAYDTRYFDDIIVESKKIDRRELLKNMRELRKMGLVSMYRGLFNDDDEIIGGTQFGITPGRELDVEKLIKQYEKQLL